MFFAPCAIRLANSEKRGARSARFERDLELLRGAQLGQNNPGGRPRSLPSSRSQA
jgi:hypothetical protein